MVFFRHNSRLLEFRRPFGAAVCGQLVEIEAEISGDLAARAQLRLWLGNDERLLPMIREGDRARASFHAPDHPGLLWYSFLIHCPDGQCLQYGANSGESALYMHEPPSWQLTVYAPAFTTPRWFCQGIAYQIFPDRFRRSSWEDFRARAQYHAGKNRFLRLHDRWSDPIHIAPSPGQSVYAPDDFYGGDLNGIREKLPYLVSLGVTVLYLNPIFESASNHRYDTADYHRIDPILGGEEAFRALCAEAKAQGLRLMLDGVFSHTGADSRYFDRYGRYEDLGAYESKDSPYYGWYRFTKYPDEYDCWWRFPSLPNVNELEPGYQAFMLGEEGVLAHWAGAGAANWRLDVADELPDDFIRAARRRLKRLDPESVLIGEVWEDCSNKLGPEGRRAYVDGDLLDGAMNYPFAEAVIDFLTEKIGAHALNDLLQTQRERYPKPFYEACLNLIDSHDTVRALTALSGAPERNALTRVQQAAFAPGDENTALGRRRLMLAAAIQMAMPGVPCIYYGDEIGMAGMADPFNRAPYPWGQEDAELLEVYRRLTGARRDLAELKQGYCRMGALTPDVFCVIRYTGRAEDISVLLVNRGRSDQCVTLCPAHLGEGPDADKPVPLGGSLIDVLTGDSLVCGGILETVVPPLTARLYTR